MPKFTTPENLYFQIDKQSVGPYTEGNEANEILRVFQPEQGIDVLYRNPLTNNDSTEIIEDRDSRIQEYAHSYRVYDETMGERGGYICTTGLWCSIFTVVSNEIGYHVP